MSVAVWAVALLAFVNLSALYWRARELRKSRRARVIVLDRQRMLRRG